MTSTAVVAVDVGGTKIRAGSVIDDTVGHIREAPTPATQGRVAVLDSIAEVVRSVLRDTEAEVPGSATLRWRLGVGSAGVIDPETGTVVSATDSLAGWAGTLLTAELTDRLGFEARAVNDVHAHALGESFAGAARGTRSSLLVAAGTGIGGGFITEGRLLTGRASAAGHIGHIPVAAAQGLPCPCGGEGHVEAIASGPAILAAYRRAGGGAGSRSSVASARNDVSSTRQLAEAARSGDAIAQQAFAQAGRALGSALGGLANVLSPEAIVIGGGLAGAGDHWRQPLREAFESELIPAVRGLELRPAELGQDAALLGAASLWSTDTGSTDTGEACTNEETE
ncbi:MULTISPECIES: ROK family protein [Brevibacterium]|uniref:Glucokinase n=2 Tax=Brevibacterium TaxID=1696 RepID=A0A1H1PL03_BRESA|nr:ROK family protein [Brevibacterium sandarakinum]SDS11439.1 glucokinase [Brevibacterium sandarakinum]